MPILPVRQNAQSIAQPTCVEMQKVMRRRVGDEDRLDVLAVREPQQELRRAVARAFAPDDVGGRRRGTRGRAAPRRSRARSVISAKSVTPRLWIHWKIWRAWNARMSRATRAPASSSCSSSLGEVDRGSVDMTRLPTGPADCKGANSSLDYVGRAAATASVALNRRSSVLASGSPQCIIPLYQ